MTQRQQHGLADRLRIHAKLRSVYQLRERFAQGQNLRCGVSERFLHVCQAREELRSVRETFRVR